MNYVDLALNICTYHRREYIEKNIGKLLSSHFFTNEESEYYGHMEIFVVDNGSELQRSSNERVHLFYNKNTGGSGGFQRGLEEIRNSPVDFSHVIFMDDDVEFELETFYILFDFLKNVDSQYAGCPVAGRMFCMDAPDVQYTAGEIWNKGKIEHVEYRRQITAENYHPGKVTYDSGAEYGGWWFCCFPMSFAKENDILPFFIHCDDVEYGIRCGRMPIIIEGVQVWHETYEKRLTPLMLYYDTRNPLFVNEIHHFDSDPSAILSEWKQRMGGFHAKQDWLSEFYVILAMYDFLKGISWLKSIDAQKYHKKLQRIKSTRIKNALAWRFVERLFWKKYGKDAEPGGVLKG